MTIEIAPFKRYTARVAIRRGPSWTVRPEAECLDGKAVNVEAFWLIDDLDHYAGEWAMVLLDKELRREELPMWIASGDLADLREVPYSALTPTHR